MKKKISLLIVVFGIFLSQSCTDLDSEVFSVVTPDNFFTNEAQLAATVATAYTPLYSWWSAVSIESDLTTDVATCPIRSNGGWNDGGLWPRRLNHDFRANEGGQIWNMCYGGISSCNRILEIIEPQLGPDAPVVGEMKTLRAFYFLHLLDYYGNIPVETRFAEADPLPSQNTPAETFEFIEAELLKSIDNLVEEKDKYTYAKINKWVGYMILANLYINAERYGVGAHWQEAADALNSIIQDGPYVLEGKYFANFKVSNEGSKENMFVVPYDKRKTGGFNIRYEALHQSADITFGFSTGPWGGFSVQEDFYNAFDENDTRRRMFIVGQQYTQEGQPSYSDELGFFYKNPQDAFKVKDCNEDFDQLTDEEKIELGVSLDPEEGCNVFITPGYKLSSGRNVALYRMGARYGKYEYDQNSSGGSSNDFAIYRYAEALLMRAEALFRISGENSESTMLVNQVRERAGLDPLVSLTLNDIYWEIKKETALEGSARLITIRFGHYEDPWFLKDDQDPNHRIYPIPESQMQANVNLVQNPGY